MAEVQESKPKITDWLPRFVARVPTTVHTKLLVAFLILVVLLIMVGLVGLQVLTGVNSRVEDMERKLAASKCNLFRACALSENGLLREEKYGQQNRKTTANVS